MTVLLKKGDAVHVFDPAQPDGEAPLRTVARVAGKGLYSNCSLWLDGEKGAAGWDAGGHEKLPYCTGRSIRRLLRPADLPAAREKARQDKLAAEAKKADESARADNVETLSPMVSAVRSAQTLPAQHEAMALLRRALDVILLRGMALLLVVLASCGGGDGGCTPPCGGSLVCCDFESGRKCVDPEQCK